MYKIHGYCLQTSHKRHLGKGKKTWQGGMAYLALLPFFPKPECHLYFKKAIIYYIIIQIYISLVRYMPIEPS